MSSVNFAHVAVQVLAEMIRRGGPAPLCEEEMRARVESYRDWLENYVTAMLFEELGRLNKLPEYTALPDGDHRTRERFLSLVVPNYKEFLKRAVTAAAYALVGRPSQTSKSGKAAA